VKMFVWGTLAALAAVMGVEAQPAATSCPDLVNLKLPHVTVSEAVMSVGGALQVKSLCPQ
jgi:hypothetical protein